MRLGSVVTVSAATLILFGGQALAQHPRATFAGVTGPGVLGWEMSCEAAQAALARAGVRPTIEEATGVFEGAGATGGWAEVTFQTLRWHAGGRDAYAECESYRLTSVRYVRHGLPSEAAARAAVGPFVTRYGPASEQHDTEYAAHVWEWLNAAARLSVIVVRDPSAPATWNVIEQWSPASSARSW